jgi:hypothetical protein
LPSVHRKMSCKMSSAVTFICFNFAFSHRKSRIIATWSFWGCKSRIDFTVIRRCSAGDIPYRVSICSYSYAALVVSCQLIIVCVFELTDCRIRMCRVSFCLFHRASSIFVASDGGAFSPLTRICFASIQCASINIASLHAM